MRVSSAASYNCTCLCQCRASSRQHQQRKIPMDNLPHSTPQAEYPGNSCSSIAPIPRDSNMWPCDQWNFNVRRSLIGFLPVIQSFSKHRQPQRFCTCRASPSKTRARAWGVTSASPCKAFRSLFPSPPRSMSPRFPPLRHFPPAASLLSRRGIGRLNLFSFRGCPPRAI